MRRREFLAGTLAGTCLLVPVVRTAAASAERMEIFKDPLCGCCESWAAAMKAAGFTVEIHDESDMTAIKSRFAIPAELEACHTALVQGYVVEGHVPADLIRRMLDENATFRGLTVPGMPIYRPEFLGPSTEVIWSHAIDSACAAPVPRQADQSPIASTTLQSPIKHRKSQIL